MLRWDGRVSQIASDLDDPQGLHIHRSLSSSIVSDATVAGIPSGAFASPDSVGVTKRVVNLCTGRCITQWISLWITMWTM